MQGTLAALTLILMMAMVITRAIMLRRAGVDAMNFGRTDKTDFLIIPFAALLFYTIFGDAFGWPLLSTQTFFQSEALAWVGVGLCFGALVFLLLSLIAFGRSFRVGIDTEHPDELVTSGIFSISRNPIYVGFLLMLLGQFLVFPNWVLLIYLLGGFWLINRQIVREEAFLREHYGQVYVDYCGHVRRYL